MAGAGHWAAARAEDLRSALQVIGRAIEQRSLPDAEELKPAMMLTIIAVLVVPFVLAILANKKGRRLFLDTIETILATALVILLLSIVLGLPIGAVYLMLKALSYVLRSFWNSAAAASAFATLRSRVGL